MSNAYRILPALLFPLALACSGGEETDDTGPQFTSNGTDEDGTGTADEIGDESGDADQGTDSTGTGEESSSDGVDTDDDTTTTAGTDTTGADSGETEGECATSSDAVGSSCGQDNANYGSIAIGETLSDLPLGTIYMVDNGLGNGYEDWYRFDFPIDDANPRPSAGTASISFTTNDNEDYRFELFRDCGAQVYGQGLAAEFGSNAPPLLEWSFNDLDPGAEEQLDYLEMVLWPSTVWVRVFRTTNDQTCSQYQLEVTRSL
ncbi:hypothetical protein G6O69_17840 [Pseudenhygromyxa sp. WMMC2535]|uniref:hypothetical protein n=1 Tax=Pseudenhygromyxa sp. WMMC2535 TaxID=2712867 RepID=UPI001557EC92|nr:hypothetical protein [Pseudenhygromyxa sp. WMMC2535]NVB39710.1 hypothetical protein [Pseudenhygromyxa sp. WMMC2535]